MSRDSEQTPTPTRATIVSAASGSSDAARITWTSRSTTIRDGAGRETVLTHGIDVEALAVRRTPPPEGSAPGAPTRWTLDLMQNGVSRARIQAPPWDFDRDHGPAEAAQVAGLPLVQRPPRIDDPPVPIDPRARGRFQPALFATVILSPLLLCVVILTPALREMPLVWAALSAVGLPFLISVRAPAMMQRRSRGEVVFRARPHAAGAPDSVAAIIRRDDVLVVRTDRRTYAVPLPGDACGPVEVRPAQWEGVDLDTSRSAELLQLRTSTGHAAATLARHEWCADGSEEELAAALGITYDPQPVTASALIGVPSITDRAPSMDRAIVLVSGAGPAALATGLMGEPGTASLAAVVLGGVNLALGLATIAMSLVVQLIRDRRRASHRTVPGRD